MKASELRIGNYVTDEFYDPFKSVFEIDSINKKGINLLIEDDGNWPELAERWIDCEYTFDKLRGIPLTEQWLIDFGFKKYYETVECGINEELEGFKLNDWDIMQDVHGSWFLCGTDFNVNRFKYVHQLQNLYHSLTGEELIKK